MLFNSVKEINRLRKEVNMLLSKRMSSIYLKITIETFSKLPFCGFNFNFERNYDVFKVKEAIHCVEQKYENENKKSHT